MCDTPIEKSWGIYNQRVLLSYAWFRWRLGRETCKEDLFDHMKFWGIASPHKAILNLKFSAMFLKFYHIMKQLCSVQFSGPGRLKVKSEEKWWLWLSVSASALLKKKCDGIYYNLLKEVQIPHCTLFCPFLTCDKRLAYNMKCKILRDMMEDTE